MAANMGALAESFGLRQGLKYRGAIKDALLTVLKLDPAFQQGSADRALGRWYFKVPGTVRRQQAEVRGTPAPVAHLRARKAPRHISFSPRPCSSSGRDAEARAELQKVLDAPVDPAWAPEDREFKAKAQRRCRGDADAKTREFQIRRTPTPADSELLGIPLRRRRPEV